MKLAVGKKKKICTSFTDWEAILSEIITGELSQWIGWITYFTIHDLGVSYGRFDHHKLIEVFEDTSEI